MSNPQETFVRTTLLPGSLIARRRDVVASNTLQYQLDVLKKTGRYDAFKLKWHPSYSDPPDHWPVPNHLFWDSDIGKWIEGACYFVSNNPTSSTTDVSAIEAAIHELVQMIRSAQQPDGYLNIHYTVVEPGHRFTNLRDMHELYNCGHLIEAALAHHAHFKTTDLLDPLLKYVDLLYATFGPGQDQIHGYPGHPEIELALLRLYKRTGNTKHLELATYFLTERGNPKGVEGRPFYIVEAEKRDENPATRPKSYPEPESLWYCQAHLPIAEQDSVEGHSVRAMYLLTAVADLVGSPSPSAPNSQDEKLKASLYRLWSNMVSRKMYLTGGIGAIKQWEGFGINYFLPQGTDEGGCYAETCASIAVMMLAERLLSFDLDGRFADVMELCLYNTVLTSMSHDGTKFTYVNQLASSEADLSKREEWFTCACCPPNVLRLFGSIGGYVYTQAAVNEQAQEEGRQQINVHMFIPSTYRTQVEGTGEDVELTQRSNWPWDGKVDFEVKTKSSSALEKLSLAIRIPGWATSWKITPSPPTTTLEKGYIHLPGTYLATNPTFTLDIPLLPRLVSPHPYTNQDTVALMRGPVVYCVEDVDNPWVQDHFKSLQLDAACKIVEEPGVKDPVTGDTYVGLKVAKGCARLVDAHALHAVPGVGVEDGDRAVKGDGVAGVDELKFVPYYFRANRGGRGQMRVGLRRWHR